MFITALGKHLPFVFSRCHGDQGDPYWLNHMLDLVYLVESARHSMDKFLRLTMGQGNAPNAFQSGVDFSGAELDRQWRVMASYIEFESFMSASKRFLDRAWCALSEERGGECGKIRTLGRILLGKEPKIRRFREQLSRWGNELASIRNYAEHNSPFGGRSVGYTICRDGTEEIILVLPDRIPGSTDATPKDKLPYSNQRSATALVRESMEHIDRAMEQLVEAADLHRKQCPSRQTDPKTNTP